MLLGNLSFSLSPLVQFSRLNQGFEDWFHPTLNIVQRYGQPQQASFLMFLCNPYFLFPQVFSVFLLMLPAIPPSFILQCFLCLWLRPFPPNIRGRIFFWHPFSRDMPGDNGGYFKIVLSPQLTNDYIDGDVYFFHGPISNDPKLVTGFLHLSCNRS